MPYLIAILISVALFGAFLLLTALERARGVRLFAGARQALDERASRVAFILGHVDWPAFLKHASTVVLERVTHDIAHAVLLLVRLVERLLTRIVRSLRERREHGPKAAPEEQKNFLDNARATFRRMVRRAQALRHPEGKE